MRKKATPPKKKTHLVCAICRKDWRGATSPAYCPDCHKLSYPVSAAMRKKKRRGKKAVKRKVRTPR